MDLEYESEFKKILKFFQNFIIIFLNYDREIIKIINYKKIYVFLIGPKLKLD